MRAALLTPTAIADGITTSWAKFLEAGARPPAAAHDYVYASSWRPCLRRMVYDLAPPTALPPWPAEVLARFRYGDDRERDTLIDLARIGRDSDPPFRVHAQQERFALRDRKGRQALVGKVDARLELAGARPPLEVKAWSPYVVDRIETFRDVLANPWTRAGGYQLLAYLFGAGEPFGFLLLVRSGLPRLLAVELEPHYDEVEGFLTKAEQALDHVAAGTLPDYHDDPAECRRCPWYGHTCNPPLSAQVATVLTDPELEALLERRQALKGAADDFDDLDKEVKRRLRGVEHGIAGAFEIVGTWGKQSRVELPPALKAQYTKTDPKGRFTLEITRL